MHLSLTGLVKCLRNIGVESAQAEALLVLEYFTKKSRSFWLSGCSIDIDDVTIKKIDTILAGRKKHIPVQYLMGWAPFRDLDLEVSPNVLIPRPETEILVDWVLDRLPENGKFLDLGTGSGAIAISVAIERPDVQVTAVDISSAALEVAARNSIKYGVDKKINFVKSDIFACLPLSDRFDVIGANLPYVTVDEYQNLTIEVKDYEPRLALIADGNGMALIKKAVHALPERLSPGGFAIFEMSPWQVKSIIDFMNDMPGGKTEVIFDLCGRERFVAWKASLC